MTLKILRSHLAKLLLLQAKIVDIGGAGKEALSEYSDMGLIHYANDLQLSVKRIEVLEAQIVALCGDIEFAVTQLQDITEFTATEDSPRELAEDYKQTIPWLCRALQDYVERAQKVLKDEDPSA